jgi:hypothetical protein
VRIPQTTGVELLLLKFYTGHARNTSPAETGLFYDKYFMRIHELITEQEDFDLATWLRQWSTRDSVKQNAEWYAQKYPRVPIGRGMGTISWPFANMLERTGIMATTPLDSMTLSRGGWAPNEIFYRLSNGQMQLTDEQSWKILKSMDERYQVNPVKVETEFTDLAVKHGQRLKPVGVQEMPHVNLPIPTPPKMASGGGGNGGYNGAKPNLSQPGVGGTSQNFNPFTI